MRLPLIFEINRETQVVPLDPNVSRKRNLHHQTGGYIPNLPGAVMRFSLFTNSHPARVGKKTMLKLNV